MINRKCSLLNQAHFSRKTGFTLLELTISIGISSILIAGMTSSLLMAVQANDLSNGPFHEINSTSEVVAQIDRELSYATEITTALNSGNAIEFILPDQTGDGIEEQVRYQWSGVVDSPLERIFNGGTPQQLLSSVNLFQLELDSIQKNLTGAETESSEQTWISQTSSFSSSSFRLKDGYGIGTDLVPSLPIDAVSWSITSVDVRCRRSGNINTSKKFYARIYSATSARTPDQLIDETAIQESDLPGSYQWYRVDFSNAKNRTPGERLCLTFEGEQNTSGSSYVQVLDWSFFSADTWLITRYSSGASWSGDVYKDVAVIIRGKYVTENSIEVNYCQYAKVKILPGEETGRSILSVVPTHNLPIVTGQ